MPFPQPKSRTVDAFSVSHSRPLSKPGFSVIFVLGNVADSSEKILFHASMDFSYLLKKSPLMVNRSNYHSNILQYHAVRCNREISAGGRDKVNAGRKEKHMVTIMQSLFDYKMIQIFKPNTVRNTTT